MPVAALCLRPRDDSCIRALKWTRPVGGCHRSKDEGFALEQHLENKWAFWAWTAEEGVCTVCSCVVDVLLANTQPKTNTFISQMWRICWELSLLHWQMVPVLNCSESITCEATANFVAFSSTSSAGFAICVSLGILETSLIAICKRWNQVRSTRGHVTWRIESSCLLFFF